MRWRQRYYFFLPVPKLGCHPAVFWLGAAAIVLIFSFLGFLDSRLPFCSPLAMSLSSRCATLTGCQCRFDSAALQPRATVRSLASNSDVLVVAAAHPGHWRLYLAGGLMALVGCAPPR